MMSHSLYPLHCEHTGVLMKNFFLLVLLAASCFGQFNQYQPPVFSDATRVERVQATAPIVDSLFQKFFAQRHLPGLVYGVIADGKLLYTGQFGNTDVARKVPADSRSLFRIASMSKSVTATAVMKLRDEGKISLDEPAATYLGDMKALQYLTTDARPITVRDLLTHAAGFPEDNPWGDRQLDDTDEELMELIRDGVSFSNVPGITFEYANLGFALLGRIVTVVSGTPYQRYTTEHIFKPLGMAHTVWEYADAPPQALAHGYRWKDSSWVEEALLHDGSYGAMGGLITSIEDFSKYVAFHMAAWPPRSDPDPGPVRRSSLREMHRPSQVTGMSPAFKYPAGRTCALIRGYGYGLDWIRDCAERVYTGHSGGLPGFGSNWMMVANHGIGVLAFDNLTYAGTAAVNMAVLDTIIALAKLEPRALPVSPILERRKNELVKLFPDWAHAETTGLFAENFFADIDVNVRRKRTQELYAAIGPVKKIEALKPENQLRGTFVIEGEKGSLEVFFTLTPERKPLIQQLNMREKK